MIDHSTILSRFPHPTKARDDLNGLLAVSRELSSDLLIDAYTHGIFPWEVNENGVFWFSPPERLLLAPAEFRVSKSFKKILKKHEFEIYFDTDFPQIMRHCAHRTGGSWIAPAMFPAYQKLFEMNVAHSVAAYRENRLVGGLYGVQIGKLFCGESMFFVEPNASKIALFELCHNAESLGISLIDCQIPSEHFLKWGAKIVPREDYLKIIAPLTRKFSPKKWKL